MEGDEESKPESESGMSLHDWITILRFVLILMIIVVSMNWLGDFLHAPIGIKDNPPEPSVFVRYVQVALWPAAVCFIVLSGVKLLTETYSYKQILFGFTTFVLGAVFVGMLAGEVLHREFIPGTHYLWNSYITVATFLFPVALVLADVIFAGILLFGWKRSDSIRDKLGTVLVGLSTVPAVAAFIGLCIGKEHLMLNAVWAILLFIIGMGCLEKAAAASSGNEHS